MFQTNYSPARSLILRLPPVGSGGAFSIGEREMTDETKQRIEGVARSLERLAEQLALGARPGHVEYVSKRDAAKITAALCLDLEQLAGAT